MTIAVVIPGYRAEGTIAEVIRTVPTEAARCEVRHIVVVDDACPEGSGAIAEALQDKRVTVIRHDRNLGVGGAMSTGYSRALELGAEIIVKMDADGQMDPSLMGELVRPVASGEADYAKGNRFRDFRRLSAMPGARLFGNSLLSFLIKAASGYWNIADPTNGYTAISAATLRKLNTGACDRGYFFESSMLINLNLIEAVVADVPMPARYEGHNSSLSLTRAALTFPYKIAKGMLKRVSLKYFVYDFNMASVYMAIGIPMFAFGTVRGLMEWVQSIATGQPRAAGTIMLVALPIIVSFQMLLQAISIDIASVPSKRTPESRKDG